MNRHTSSLIVMTLLIAACGGDAGEESPESTVAASDTSAASASATVVVQLEAVQGFFTEGFEVGLRIEDENGASVIATLWSEFVESQSGASASDYYGSVLEVEVPAGSLSIFATANVGIGPGPQIPDVSGDLRCRLDVSAADGERIDVEVSFSGEDDCLRQL